MDHYSAQSISDALKNKINDYIKTVYLGKNEFLRKACNDELENEISFCQEPFIEANQCYKSINDGINKADIPMNAKKILNMLMSHNLGVYKDPYSHQIQALESYFKGKDLLVATGTGSGKTECFIWPLLCKLINEAMSNQATWKMRGIRALILYPMNALASDQLGRLRRIMNVHSGEFVNAFNELVLKGYARLPQFGIYTGRTPYPGLQKIEYDQNLANTLKKELLEIEDDTVSHLREIGKYPSKNNFSAFVKKLEQGQHESSPNDTELLTRQEMQKNCPDILITNYSMLEYMLFRPIEQTIWKDTRSWLKSSPDNKLLFIIDEAHMYRGSSGGEVSLLIRRVMNKLDVDRDKFQFILTSASIPSNKRDDVNLFAQTLCAQNNKEHSFDIIVGEKEDLPSADLVEICPDNFENIEIDDFMKDNEKKLEAIREFSIKAGFDAENCRFSDMDSVGEWLYLKLQTIAPMIRIMNSCRGKAINLDDLSRIAFPNAHPENAQKATNILLAIAPYAKNKFNQNLFSARVHLFFRGLQGVFACTNPNCSNLEKPNGLGLGQIYFYQEKDVCSCGGKIFELENDRTCGAIFLRGYFGRSDTENKFVWNIKSDVDEDEFDKVLFYILTPDTNLKKSKDIVAGWFNSITGRLEMNDNNAGKENYLHVAFYSKIKEANALNYVFSSCPKCGKRNLRTTDFSTKGNEPFFNLISEQLHSQPPSIFDPKKIELSPNRGRKVLLFSDSRQRAAILAKDLTRAADEDAMRKALCLAADKLQRWENRSDGFSSKMTYLYPAFLEIACENNLKFFYGEDHLQYRDHLLKMKTILERYKVRGREVNYQNLNDEFKPIPGLYHEQLLRHLCHNFRSLTDICICWVEPGKDKLDFIDDRLYEKDIKMTIQQFKEIFSAWANEVLTDSYSLDAEIPKAIRENITNIDRFGLNESKLLPKKMENFLKEVGNYSEKEIETIKEILIDGFTSRDKEYRFINPSLITLKIDPFRDWYYCPKCSHTFPFTFFNKCLRCFEGVPQKMEEKNFEGQAFWRNPILQVLKGDTEVLISNVNAEEHTAQLSHKDQRHNIWSTTEDFEMRFQNIVTNSKNYSPVDVLSCTTTMEVGIDIGSLNAIGLRNVPPMRENYQQRSGRAGRRGTAISSIITYTDNGPHDSFYFFNPEQIICGEVRVPWIDGYNKKLIIRHFIMVILTEYFLQQGNIDLYEITFKQFLDDHFDRFVLFLSRFFLSEEKVNILLPPHSGYSLFELKKIIQEKFNEFKTVKKDKIHNHELVKGSGVKLFDVLFDEGFIPSYSFPKNVVSFYVEKDYGEKIEQKPERSLDIAISEYAPGKIIVINKRTYKSGGLYSPYSKRKSGTLNAPAKQFFDIKNNENIKDLYSCKNPSCLWFGTKKPIDDSCPFCKEVSIERRTMVKPWGFGPIEGVSIRESEAESQYSYASSPCYSTTPDKQDMVKVEKYDHIRIAQRSSQEIVIVNKGFSNKGFTVCKSCGAAIPGDSEEKLQNIGQPYQTKYTNKKCHHYDNIHAFLGHQFLTDLIVFEFTVDNLLIDVSFDNKWKIIAGQTLAEALVLSSSRFLDIDFNDLKSGYRIRYDKNKTYIDVFIFDSLSSGAGYSTEVANNKEEILRNTFNLLANCSCDSSCTKCLNHFWNQRVQDNLNRHFGIELLNWATKSKLADPVKEEDLNLYYKSLFEIFTTDKTYNLSKDGGKIFITKNGAKKELFIYPSMWRCDNKLIPGQSIRISDYLVKNSLPSAYTKILHMLE